MHKNIWFLLTAALSLNIAVFADAQEGQEDEPSIQMNAIFASNEGEDQIKKPILGIDEEEVTKTESLFASNEVEEQIKKPVLGVDEEEVTKAESLFASNEVEEQIKKPILEVDDSDDETDSSFVV